MNCVLIVLSCALISLAATAPILEKDAKIINYESTNDGKGNYKFSFETSNGIIRRETGTLVNAGQPDEHIVVEGSFSYLNPNGERVSLSYTADENGNHIFKQPQVIYAGVPGSAVATLLGK